MLSCRSYKHNPFSKLPKSIPYLQVSSYLTSVFFRTKSLEPCFTCNSWGVGTGVKLGELGGVLTCGFLGEADSFISDGALSNLRDSLWMHVLFSQPTLTISYHLQRFPPLSKCGPVCIVTFTVKEITSHATRNMIHRSSRSVAWKWQSTDTN